MNPCYKKCMGKYKQMAPLSIFFFIIYNEPYSLSQIQTGNTITDSPPFSPVTRSSFSG